MYLASANGIPARENAYRAVNSIVTNAKCWTPRWSFASTRKNRWENTDGAVSENSPLAETQSEKAK